MPNLISKKIKIFSFFMSVLVILVHSLSNVDILKDFMSRYIQPISIIPFFVISGFLFFRNVNNINDVLKKMGKRVKTLLIPYVIWNIIYYIFYIIFKEKITFSLDNMFTAISNYEYNPTFWFLYQLIVLSFITPFIFYMVKDKKSLQVSSIIVLVILFLGADFPYINEDAFVYYFLGCAISKQYKEGFYILKSKYAVISSLVLSMGMFFIVASLSKLSIYSKYIYNISIMFTIFQRFLVSVFIFTVFDFICKYKEVKPYMNHTFFIYAIHYVIIRLVDLLVDKIKIFEDQVLYRNIFEIIVFVLSPVLVITISYYLYKVMNEKCKKVLGVLTGGR